eukprot:CAMPEP_0119007458 /NCGR_PEP_ID=MMETSP1176-20130426/3025_1 /TAXON_ID=265551 /ORGANISM="Synedropsis recta cf, Strain CCMP1620" /LENGTH=343 /DNA_ID=CAMNT_0006959615 /DNA_START=1 /DNA_END=1032 /DNA_ORIENTATION=+
MKRNDDMLSTRKHKELTTDEDLSDSEASSEEDSEDSDDYSTSSSYLSSDAEDEFLSMFPQGGMGLKKSASMPNFQGEEMSTMQVAILLNQVRVDDLQKNHQQQQQHQRAPRRHSMVPLVGCDASTKTAPGRLVNMKHIQGEGSGGAGEPDTPAPAQQHPTDMLNEILGVAGFNPQVLSFDETADFFQGVTASRLSSYSTDIISAVRNSDLDFLRMSYTDLNRDMNACNRFGESILHTACRKSQVEVVKFLVHEANVSVRVRDDFGRTPCHDAAWQGEPNMELIELVITECPDLLLVQDKRGFTPLQYVREPQRKAWNDMLDRLGDKVLPNTLIKRGDGAGVSN